MTICALVLGIIAIIIPNLAPPVATGGGLPSPCINNLSQIDAAAKQFALEHNLTNGETINYPNDLTPYIRTNKQGLLPPCPKGGVYHISKVGENPTCSLGTTATPPHVLQ